MNRRVRKFQLREDTIELIIKDLSEQLGLDREVVSMSLVQVLAIMPRDGRTFLGIDYRATPVDFESLPPVKLRTLDTLAVLAGEGSCHAASLTGDYLEGLKLPDSWCR